MQIVLGRLPEHQPAQLHGQGVFWAQHATYPMISPRPDGVAEGLLLENLSPEDIARLDFYEGPYDYKLQPVTLLVEGASQDGVVYMPPDPGPTPDAPWELADWQQRYGAVALEAASEIMSYFGQCSAQAVAGKMPVILTRAQARLNGKASQTPRHLRQGGNWEDVSVLSQTRPYSNFYTVEEVTLKYPQFSKRPSPEIQRAVFVSADAVTVLPYDPARDEVLLLEQFRVGPYMRHDPVPWGLEAIAGRIDAYEDPETAARREAQEEAGLRLGTLHLVGKYYPSPGAKTEYLYSYVAICDLAGKSEGVGGLLAENEDIRTMIVSFDALEEALHAGEIENGPLMLSVLWLQKERAILRRLG